ncbi:helix-turn-helix transcriptional regulator, partial [Fluviicola sp.]|uniref:helix-turn-helix domain-containing protein n=1 Tax=Fluviicola sp. TaxID=1917219 RepID=UPI002822CA8C
NDYFVNLVTKKSFMEIGENIKKFRELKNLTRNEMADRLHVSLSAYGKIERGDVDLTISRANEIAQILSVDLPQLLNFDVQDVFNITNTNNQIIQNQADSVHFHSDNHTERYISLLEKEVQRLNEVIEKMRS